MRIRGTDISWGSVYLTRRDSTVVASRNLLVLREEDLRFIPLFADFHMHTTYSDGRNTPIEMLIEARRVGLDVVAITDHGATLGAKAARRFVRASCAHMIALHAEENPCDFPNTHLLAYGVPCT